MQSEKHRRVLLPALAALVILLLLASGCTQAPSSSQKPASAIITPGIPPGTPEVTTPRETVIHGTVLPTPGTAPALPQDTPGAAEFMNAPVYGEVVSFYGTADHINELNCPCFFVTDNGTSVHVWYGLMVYINGTAEPSLSIEGLKNGDTVLVTGVLQDGTDRGAKDNFWASRISRVTS